MDGAEIANAERSFLGSILLDNRHFQTFTTGPKAWQSETHLTIYLAMLYLRRLGRQIDIVTLTEELSSKGNLERTGGVAYLSALVDSVEFF